MSEKKQAGSEEPKQVKIEELTVEQLEAAAYRLILQANGIQNALNAVQAELAKRQK